jgi:hypothetical protein
VAAYATAAHAVCATAERALKKQNAYAGAHR